jgi:hypothetical protein
VDERAFRALTGFTDDQWKRLIWQLARYALGVSRGLRWRTQSPIELPGGETIDSIVSKAIEKVFSGERRWDPGKEPDLGKYLQGVIDSLLSHLAEGKDNTMFAPVPNTVGGQATAEWESGMGGRPHGAEWIGRPVKSPEKLLLEQQAAKRDDRVLELLIDECSVDAPLSKVLQAMFDGYEKRAEIAEATGLPENEVSNAGKRLDRKLAKLRLQLLAKDKR